MLIVTAYPRSRKIVTGLASGQICVLYSPLTSLNGAKLPLNKGPPRKATIEDMSDAVSAPTIITPHALPMFRDGEIARGSKRKREKDRMDPRKSRRPELPVTGPGRGGRVGASATQHVVQNLVRDTTRDEDVRTFSFVFRMLFSQIMPASLSGAQSLGLSIFGQNDGHAHRYRAGVGSCGLLVIWNQELCPIRGVGGCLFNNTPKSRVVAVCRRAPENSASLNSPFYWERFAVFLRN